MKQKDTIAALATPPGRGGIGVLRISGPLAARVAYATLGKVPRPRQAEYLPFRDENGVILDQGIAIFFSAPHSFTGEDILELQGHGAPIVLDLLLKRIVLLPGVRIANPGEFSERAFLNEKLDLSQAEAIIDLINASSQQAARSALNSLQGMFSVRIYELVEILTKLRTYIEAHINFPNEGIDSFADDKIEYSLNNAIIKLNAIRMEAHQGSLLRDGIKVVITGKPNAGKSTLLNVLARREVAIVTSIAGTTRDVLHENIYLDGMPIHIIDTAGLRDARDEIEQIGIDRAWNEIKQADHILLIVDASITSLNELDTLCLDFIAAGFPSDIPITIVRNKADLTGESIAINNMKKYSVITLSAQSGSGIDLLRTHLKQCIGFTNNTEGIFLARHRHLESIEIASAHLQKGKELLAIASSEELLAEELQLAQQALSKITGKFSSDDLLNSIFSNFCIGK